MAAVSALLVASFSDLLSCSARRSVVIQSTPASFFSLSTSSATVLTLTPALRLGRLGGLQHFEPRRDVDAESAGVFSSIGFFFAFMMLGSEA